MSKKKENGYITVPLDVQKKVKALMDKVNADRKNIGGLPMYTMPVFTTYLLNLGTDAVRNEKSEVQES